ncbi:MAG TPA: hypothetical protein P5132_09575, partial [Bacteroidales bacterium]|nr:hypothetical protein [Bacteroidales bacterium]
SASIPINGFNSEGICCATNIKLTSVLLIPSFDFNNGTIGAKKAEYTSCTKCVIDIIKTLFS